MHKAGSGACAVDNLPGNVFRSERIDRRRFDVFAHRRHRYNDFPVFNGFHISLPLEFVRISLIVEFY
jgi:hypothetical protein